MDDFRRTLYWTVWSSTDAMRDAVVDLKPAVVLTKKLAEQAIQLMKQLAEAS